MRSKECKRCLQVKPVSEFYKQKGMKFGRMSNCKVCHKITTTEYRLANPEKARLTRLKGHVRRLYGLSWDQYLTLYEAQDGRCGVCGTAYALAAEKGLVVDHDHKTLLVRGLLCPRCNAGLGSFDDSIEGLMRAVNYLAVHASRDDPAPWTPGVVNGVNRNGEPEVEGLDSSGTLAEASSVHFKRST